MDSQIQEALELIEMLTEDQDCSKKVAEGLKGVANLLKGSEELKIQKAIHAIEELDLQGISSHLRNQIWELISFLESMA